MTVVPRVVVVGSLAVGGEVVQAATVPVLGVCLGMQGLVTSYGGTVERIPPAHGCVATVNHNGSDLFSGIPSPYSAVRYHSLAATRVPSDLAVTASCDDPDAPVPPRVRPQRVRGAIDQQLHRRGAGAMNSATGTPPTIETAADPVPFLTYMAARHDRCFWLDGGAARSWSSNRSLLGWLDEEDTSISYNAARREVTRP
jgi:hypothetical protein